MSADVLRQAAALMRSPGSDPFCGHTETDGWFDRTICAEPCGSMHNICVDCGRIQGYCPVAVEGRAPSPFLLALAGWLDHAADRWSAITEWNSIYVVADQTWLEREPADMPDLIKALAVAHAYLGTPP